MKSLSRLVLAVSGWGAATAACAHTGHATDSLFAGLAHPLAADHLLAMVAVGIWSAAALPAGRRALGPLVFMTGLLAGAIAGLTATAGPLLEIGVVASVAAFAALVLAPRALPLPLALGIVVAAAGLHGLAHGAELPLAGTFAAYAAGFLAASAVLHALGLALGGAMLRARCWVWRAAAAALGTSAMVLLALA